VPSTRGPERYRPSAEIIDEILGLVGPQAASAAVREVTLLGQTVNSYVDPSGALEQAADAEPGESEFAQLLREIVRRAPGLARLRYEAPHPRHLGATLMRAHRELEVLARHLHLPVQSGSDSVLRRMIRRHTRSEFVARVERLRAAVPDLTLSTDIIVGFPGETEADFLETLSLLDEVGIVGVFGFMYSPRPNTAALRLGDGVPEPVKAERLQRLFEHSARALNRRLAGLVGSTQQVLVEGPSKLEPANASGRTERNEIVHIVGAQSHALEGQIVAAEITEALGHSLLAKLVGPLDEQPRAR